QNGVHPDVPAVGIDGENAIYGRLEGIGNFGVLATVCVYGQHGCDPLARCIVFRERHLHHILAKDRRVIIGVAYFHYKGVVTC
uniref:Uncharacterized protein n=1 Tax=Neogobius melanostomus TaxID=47308 RepID=A0A8C6UEH4_9GOBI